MAFEPVTPDPTVSQLMPAEATAKLAEMQNTLHPPAPIKPEDAQGARQRLGELSKNPSWSKALFAGDTVVTKEFHDLVALSASGDVVADSLAGIVEEPPIFETTVDGQLPRRVVQQAVADFRADGLDDAAIGQAINGGAVSLAEHRAATALLNARKSDPAWVKALMSGDYTAKREWTLLSVILSCDIAEPK
jgi:hypothetical protein